MTPDARTKNALPLSLFVTLRALPLGLTLVLVSGIILLANIRALSSTAQEKSLNNHAAQLSETLNHRLDQITQQISGIASSSFLRNAIKGPTPLTADMLQQYLGSLSPSGLQDLPIALTDSQGLILYGAQGIAELQALTNWQEKVLRKQEITKQWHGTNLLIGAPIITQELNGNKTASGALVAKLGSTHFEQLFSDLPTDTQFIVLDHQQKILISTQPTIFIPEDQFAAPKRATPWRFNTALALPSYNAQLVVFAEKATTGPMAQEMMIILGIALPIVLIAILGTIFISGRIVTHSVSDLTNTMKSLMQHENSALNFRANMAQKAPKELTLLATTFNTLLDKLSCTTTSRQEMMSILCSLSEMLVVTDHDGMILWFNTAYQTFMRHTDQSIKKMLSEHSDWHPAELNTRNGGLEVTYHRPIDKLEKSGITILWSRTLYFNENNEHKGFIYTGQNITKTREAEQALKLEQRNLKAARTEADQANQAKSNFLASMSHEIRTPMNGVLGMIGLLLKSNLTTRQRTQAYLAESSARSLLTLINDILDFSKIEANTLDLANRPFDLVNTLTECAQILALSAFKKGIELVLDLNGIDQRKLRGDHTRLRQILTNLASNAIKFTDRGHIIIRATLTPPHNGERMLTLNIEDTGIGIPKEKLPTLFEAFYQSDDDKNKDHSGAGLGLAIVYRLTHLMGGDVSVSSEVGRGSTFTATVRLGSNLPYESAHPKRILTNYKALVVDDVQASLTATTTALEILGAEVFSALSIEHAVYHCQHQEEPSHYDLLLIDARLSTPNNQTLIEQLKPFLKPSAQAEPPIVYLGDITQELDANTEFQGKTYLLKPILPSMLEAICQLLLHGNSNPESQHFLISPHIAKSQTEQTKPVAEQGQENRSKDMLDSAKTTEREAEPNSSAPSDTYKEALDKTPEETLETALDETLDETEEHNTLHILLVEDNKINQAVAMGILEEFELAPEIANDGLEAIEMLKRAEQAGTPYHLVLMDCQMPHLDGYDTTRAIRHGEAGDITKNIPIIAMTANAMLGDKEKCLSIGMNDYLAKPLEPTVLVEALSKWSGKQLQH